MKVFNHNPHKRASSDAILSSALEAVKRDPFAPAGLSSMLEAVKQALESGDDSLIAVGHHARSIQANLVDRHRGSGCPLTPATPPCIRVRTRRFDWLR